MNNNTITIKVFILVYNLDANKEKIAYEHKMKYSASQEAQAPFAQWLGCMLAPVGGGHKHPSHNGRAACLRQWELIHKNVNQRAGAGMRPWLCVPAFLCLE